MMPTDLDEAIRFVRAACAALGWSQRELSRRSGVPQTAISRFVRGRLDAIDLAQLAAIAVAFGARIAFTVDAPFLVDRARQRDRVHATCVAYVARRLRAAGWVVETEVEIAGRYGPGWIDILAFHPPSRRLLVIEIKTEIADLGRIQRTLGWYVHASTAAVHRLGWRPGATTAALIVLATRATDGRLRENRDLVRIAFPGHARDLRRLIEDPAAAGRIAWSVAAIDPVSRVRSWLRSTVLDDPRLAARHPDYAAVARVLEARSRRAAESARLGSAGQRAAAPSAKAGRRPE